MFLHGSRIVGQPKTSFALSEIKDAETDRDFNRRARSSAGRGQNREVSVASRIQSDNSSRRGRAVSVRDVLLPPLGLAGAVRLPSDSYGLVVFAHGSGSSRFSPRNAAVAAALNDAGFGTLLFDLLMPDEEIDRRNVFDIGLLADRLIDAIHWIDENAALSGLPLGLFGASTGAAAALVAAARLGDRVEAVVSRGGRPDLADAALELVRAPTLLIVGGDDDVVLELNQQALAKLKAPKALQIVPGATHLFPEPGALEAVIEHATRWFLVHLGHRVEPPSFGARPV
ncbi:DeoR faimly transcriptional regulator (modular protein) [Methylocella tundrae]|nr:DeoR faimly transcriptional regulator (modular protein) [Methylocella tundrae]